jgi:hypothetical protein
MKDLNDLNGNQGQFEEPTGPEVLGDSFTNDDAFLTPEPPATQVPSEDPEVDADGLFRPAQAPVNFTAQRPADGPVNPKLPTVLSFLRESTKTFQKLLDLNEDLFERLNNGDIPETEADQLWQMSLYNGMNHVNMEDTPRRATEREGSNWHQSLMHGEMQLRPGKPKQKPTNARSSRTEILSYLTKESGLGATHEAMMPHSGIWLRLRTPTLQEVVSMQQKLAQRRVLLGKESKGMAFSNVAAMMLDAITDLALNCVISSNIKYTTATDIEEQLSALDEPFLHHALGTAMYIDGFNYSHPCIADVHSCTEVTSGNLDMFALVWYDRTEFNQQQTYHLARRFQDVSREDITKYKTQFVRGQGRVVWFEKVGIRLEVPSITERRHAGNAWIQGIVEMTTGAFNEQPHEANRAAYIDKLAKASTARQYGHWVTSVWHRDDEQAEPVMVTDDRQTIDEYLDNIMSDDAYSERFFDAVTRYIDDSIVGMIAIESFNCPACNTPQAKAFHERLEHLIPLDMVTTFFTLAAQKVKNLR